LEGTLDRLPPLFNIKPHFTEKEEIKWVFILNRGRTPVKCTTKPNPFALRKLKKNKKKKKKKKTPLVNE